MTITIGHLSIKYYLFEVIYNKLLYLKYIFYLHFSDSNDDSLKKMKSKKNSSNKEIFADNHSINTICKTIW
jgi:hypothetical protein